MVGTNAVTSTVRASTAVSRTPSSSCCSSPRTIALVETPCDANMREGSRRSASSAVVRTYSKADNRVRWSKMLCSIIRLRRSAAHLRASIAECCDNMGSMFCERRG